MYKGIFKNLQKIRLKIRPEYEREEPRKSTNPPPLSLSFLVSMLINNYKNHNRDKKSLVLSKMDVAQVFTFLESIREGHVLHICWLQTI